MNKKTFTTGNAAATLFAPPEQTATSKVTPAPIKNTNPTGTPDSVFTWRATFDGEKRDRRLQITSKKSIAAKAAALARENGVSLNYLFEMLITKEWESKHPTE